MSDPHSEAEAWARRFLGDRWDHLHPDDRAELVRFGTFVRSHGPAPTPAEGDQPVPPGQRRPCACGQPVLEPPGEGCECPCHDPAWVGTFRKAGQEDGG